MVNGKYTTIGINRERYALLAERKQALEGTAGRRFSWGVFLLILAGVHVVDELVDKKKVEQVVQYVVDGFVNEKKVKQVVHAGKKGKTRGQN